MTSQGKTDSGDWWSPTSSHTWYPSHIPDLHLMVESRLGNHRGDWLDQDNNVEETRFPERKLSLPAICSRSIQEPKAWYKPTLQSPSLPVQTSTTIMKGDMDESPTPESEGEDTVEEEELEDDSGVSTPADDIDFRDLLSQKFWEEVYDSDFNTVWVITSCDRLQSTDTDDFSDVPPRSSRNSENLHQHTLNFVDKLESQIPSVDNVETDMVRREMTSKTSSGKNNHSCGQGLKSWFTRKLRKIA